MQGTEIRSDETYEKTYVDGGILVIEHLSYKVQDMIDALELLGVTE